MNLKAMLVSILGLSLVASVATAQVPSFNYVGASYTEIEDGNINYDGFELEVSGRIGENWFLSGSYADISTSQAEVVFDDLDITYGRLGYIFIEDELAALYAGPQVQYLNFDGGLGSTSETDLGVFVGLRFIAAPRIELMTEASYIDMDNSITRFSAGARFYITPSLSAETQANFGDWSGFSLGINFHF
ncbi:hypothetical protein CWE09_09240 [Aliidiomarina minuta]|uniref:Outer membrane protein beta-barrel domain-containing protein n=1 Tax=Aliidiomarina minuta TaxID=880057 RepID=A0A432W9R0_9GAMM|nr:outer membrane beta-barrel protein [Aliidiomarina minuta]RUO26854.1 hypothetical protein CWE09_09240 [Aliidiomarina minuta]